MNIENYDNSNIININEHNKFHDSHIVIKGKNNIVEIGHSKHLIQKLKIEVRGDNNKIVIMASMKVINNLMIQSIRGGNTEVYIDEDFGCGGVDIRMNDGYEKLFIGKDCLLSWGIKMRTSDGHAVVDMASGNAVNMPSNIYIGSHVWIGEDVKILKGAYIPENCVVGGFVLCTWIPPLIEDQQLKTKVVFN